MKLIKRAISLLLTLSIFLFAGCTQKDNSITLTISAASSLKKAMTEVYELYKKEKPNVVLVFNYGSSGDLQKQIENGAPSDIFFSASKKQIDALNSDGLLDSSSIKNILKNHLVLVVTKGSTNTDISDFLSLSQQRIKQIALGEPKSVPAGQYAEEVFTNLNCWDAIEKKSVFGKDVTQVLTYVENGEVDAGIVYATDAKTSQKVTVIAIAPDDTHSPIVYPAAIIKDTKHAKEAQEFLDYLNNKEATKVFEKYGFERP